MCSGCQAPLDALGRHRASCTLSSGIRKRATPVEHSGEDLLRGGCSSPLQRLFKRHEHQCRCRTAGALRFLSGLTIQWGSPVGCGRLAAQCPVCCKRASPLRRSGRCRAAQGEGTFPELIGTGRCMLAVVTIETGGRWSSSDSWPSPKRARSPST